jgi:hypothetical protein
MIAGQGLQFVAVAVKFVQFHPKRLPLQVVLDRSFCVLMFELFRQFLLLYK